MTGNLECCGDKTWRGEVVHGGGSVPYIQISLYLSLILFFFSLGGANVGATSLARVVKLPGAAGQLRGARIIVKLSNVAVFASLIVAGATSRGVFFPSVIYRGNPSYRESFPHLLRWILDLQRMRSRPGFDIGFKTVKVIYTGSWAIKDHGERCLETELLVSAGVLGKAAG